MRIDAAQISGWVLARASHSQRHFFSYLAVEVANYAVLIKGVLHVNDTDTFSAPNEYRCSNIIAGYVEIQHSDLDSFCKPFADGYVVINGQQFAMSGNGLHQQPIASIPPSIPGQYEQTRLDSWKLIGASSLLILDAAYDWAVKAGDPPYDTLRELANTYRIGPIQDECTVDLVAWQVVLIDSRSTNDGEVAIIYVRTLVGIDTDQVSVGYRTVTKGLARERGAIAGKDILWHQDGVYLLGSLAIALQRGEWVQCYARYGGRAQHQYWVLDPSTSQNPRRAIWEISDSKVERLTKWLHGESEKKRQSDFERAIAVTGWMRGFSPQYFDRESGHNTSEPDVVLTCDRGVIVVECTLEPFGPEKVAKLVKRTHSIKRALEFSGHPAMVVLAALAVAIDVPPSAALSNAYESGVLVIAGQTELDEWLRRTVHFPDANVVFDQARESMESKKANPVQQHV